MQSQWDWVEKYYTPEQLDELKARWSPEVQEKAERDWADLIADVEAALGEDPRNERAQALAKRWRELVAAFTAGNPGIEKNLRRLYTDQANWPQSTKKPYSEEEEAFIKRAMDATSALARTRRRRADRATTFSSAALRCSGVDPCCRFRWRSHARAVAWCMAASDL